MKKMYRRLLLFTSTVVFLALAPLIILYAMGYRTVARNVDPIPVGVLLVETFPRRAEVKVNERDYGKTPRAISNIPAGSAHVTITKEGYETWQKSVAVKPGLITELRSVRLFTNEGAKAVASAIESYALSPNRQLVAAYGTDGIFRLFDKDGQELPLSNQLLLHSPEGMLWAPNNTGLLAHNRDNTFDLITITGDVVALQRIPLLTAAKKLVWDPRIPGRLLVHTAQNALRAYNVTTKTSSTITANLRTFATSDRHIYIATTTNEIKVYTLSGSLIRTLPFKVEHAIEELLVTPEGALAIRDVAGQLLVERDEELVLVSDNVTYAGWSPDGRMLLVQAEPQAIHVYNESDERAEIPLHELHLVNRLSRPVTSPQWFAGGAHLLYQVEDEIIITEIDTRDHPMQHVVDTTNLGDAEAMVGEDGESLLYLKQDGNVRSLMLKMLVQPG